MNRLPNMPDCASTPAGAIFREVNRNFPEGEQIIASGKVCSLPGSCLPSMPDCASTPAGAIFREVNRNFPEGEQIGAITEKEKESKMSTFPFIDAQIAQRFEQGHTWRSVAYARAQAKLQPASNSAIEAVAGGYAVYAGPDSPLNRAAGLGLSSAVTPDNIDQIEQFYRDRHGLPRIEVCPLAHPTLRTLLRERGYRLEHFLNLLFRPIADEPLPVRLPPETTIRRASPEQANSWIWTTTQGFEGVETPSALGLAIQTPTFHSEDTLCFLAWVGAEPAAGGAMLVHNGVTEFGGASTRPAFRRRGLQTALLHTRLNVAREMGCDYALSLTSPGSESQRNIERAGFRVAYTTAFMVGP